MKIAIDKKSLKAIDNENEFVYLFNDESLEELLKLNIHCMYYKNCKCVDLNLTDYDIECIKKQR